MPTYPVKTCVVCGEELEFPEEAIASEERSRHVARDRRASARTGDPGAVG